MMLCRGKKRSQSGGKAVKACRQSSRSEQERATGPRLRALPKRAKRHGRYSRESRSTMLFCSFMELQSYFPREAAASKSSVVRPGWRGLSYPAFNDTTHPIENRHSQQIYPAKQLIGPHGSLNLLGSWGWA
jgi:hypothetical protein